MVFEILTPIGFTVRTSDDYWQKIVIKHPDMAERLEQVKQALASPIEVRCSSRDTQVLLFYITQGRRWLVAVARRLNSDGFLVTAYRTDAIKEGEVVWPR